MTRELELRRKWTFRAHGKRMVFFKKSFEGDIHVLTKVFLWALYLPDCPDLSVEIRIGDRYKPDLVQTAENGMPVFWGEARQVSQKKVHYLVDRFRSTHLVFAKWNTNLEPLKRIIGMLVLIGYQRAVPGSPLKGPTISPVTHPP